MNAPDHAVRSPKLPSTATWLALVLLLGATLAVYWGVWRFDYVSFDDPEYVAANQHVLRGLSWESVRWAFTTNYFANYLPVTWLSHMLDVSLWGLNPMGHHFTSNLIHSVNAALLFLLLRRMTGGSTGRSLAVALLFTPIASEGTRTGFYTDEYTEHHFQAPENVRKANLRFADLREARVEDVDFYLVDLRGALYDERQEAHFRRCRAILDDWSGDEAS